VFIAEVLESETSLEVVTDLVGEDVKGGGIFRVVWTDARRFKLSVVEVFKGEQPDVFELYNGGGATLKKVEDYKGDLGPIWLPDPSFSWPRPMLETGGQYLFFINRNNDSKIIEGQKKGQTFKINV